MEQAECIIPIRFKGLMPLCFLYKQHSLDPYFNVFNLTWYQDQRVKIVDFVHLLLTVKRGTMVTLDFLVFLEDLDHPGSWEWTVPKVLWANLDWKACLDDRAFLVRIRKA